MGETLMDLNNFLKIKKTGADIKKFLASAASFWVSHQQVVFIVLVIFSAVLGAYFWCRNIYRSGWSEEQKKTYNISQNREINLKEEEFKKVLAEIENRKNSFESEYQPVKDIFKPY